MANSLRTLAKKIPGLHRIFLKYVRIREKRLIQGLQPEDVFTAIYKENRWRSNESFSGPGSAIVQTRTVLESLPVLLEKFSIRTMLDIPSGDFNWLQKVSLENVRYLGADIVGEIVKNNIRDYETANISFKRLDLLTEDLPKVDLIVCRDCLVHFSYEDIQKALANIRRSGSAFLLTTSFIKHPENHDIITGQWRPLNLAAAPFNLPEPTETINEKCTEVNGIYADKSLCLWRIEDILQS